MEPRYQRNLENYSARHQRRIVAALRDSSSGQSSSDESNNSNFSNNSDDFGSVNITFAKYFSFSLYFLF